MNKKSCKDYTIKTTSEHTFRYQQRSHDIKRLIKERGLTDICNLIGDRPENIPKYLNRLTQQGKPSRKGGLR